MAKKKAGSGEKTHPMGEASEPVVKSKTSKPVAASSQDRISKLLALEVFQKIHKDHGATIIARASDDRVLKTFRIPSGVFSLDVKLGGGWPQGRICGIHGMKSTGKTSILKRTIATAQRMCSSCWTFVRWTHAVEKDEEVTDEKTGEVTKVLDSKTKEPKKVVVWEPFWVKRWWKDVNEKWRVMLRGDLVKDKDGKMVPDVTLGEEIHPECRCGKYREVVCAFIDVEGAFDRMWALRQGVDPLKLMYSRPEYAEQSLDIADALVRSGEVDILVLDSIAFLTPEQEIQESTAKAMVGVQARAVGKGVRKFVSGLNAVALHSSRRPTIFLTNQIRMKVGVMFGNPETTPGGLAPGFAASVEVRTRASTYEFAKKEKGDEGDKNDKGPPIEVELAFEIEKNKVDVPKRKGTFKVILADGETKKKGDIYDEDTVVAEAERCGLVQPGTRGGWTCLGEKFSAKSHIDRRLLTDPLFSQSLRWAVLQVLLEVDKAWNEEAPLPTPGEVAPMENASTEAEA